MIGSEVYVSKQKEWLGNTSDFLVSGGVRKRVYHYFYD